MVARQLLGVRAVAMVLLGGWWFVTDGYYGVCSILLHDLALS